jgi:uncharacterized protein (DUF302 family)
MTMAYYFAKHLDLPFAAALERTRSALADAGFGIISEIDVTETLKQKLGADFRNYRILGACNPALAYEALKAEDKIGTMLPCNVIVQDAGGGSEVAAIDPVASMQAIDNPGLGRIAGRVRKLLKGVVEGL